MNVAPPKIQRYVFLIAAGSMLIGLGVGYALAVYLRFDF